jgi:hypothetical protein
MTLKLSGHQMHFVDSDGTLPLDLITSKECERHTEEKPDDIAQVTSLVDVVLAGLMSQAECNVSSSVESMNNLCPSMLCFTAAHK